MHADRRLVSLSGGEQRFPVPVVKVRETYRVWVLDEADRLAAQPDAPLVLLDGQINVPHRKDMHRDEDVGASTAPLFEHVVVPCPHARQRQFLVVEGGELAPAEPWQRREGDG